MKYAFLCLVLMLVGCSDASSGRLTQSSLAKLQNGMSLSEVEAVLGPNTRQIINMGSESVYQWEENPGDNVRSIVCNFSDGKMSTKAGSNLPR